MIFFALAIYPYAKVGNDLVQFSQSLQQTLPSNTIIVYRDFIPDNWYMRYFSPQTKWVRISSPDQFVTIRRQATAEGNSVWIENTARQYL